MATEKAVITQSHLTDIANAIIAKGGASGPLKPSEMKAAIEAIPSGNCRKWVKPDDWPDLRKEMDEDDPTKYGLPATYTHKLGMLFASNFKGYNVFNLKGAKAYRLSDGTVYNMAVKNDVARPLDEDYFWVICYSDQDFTENIPSSALYIGNGAQLALWYIWRGCTTQKYKYTTFAQNAASAYYPVRLEGLNHFESIEETNGHFFERIKGEVSFEDDDIYVKTKSLSSFTHETERIDARIHIEDIPSSWKGRADIATYEMTELPEGINWSKVTSLQQVFQHTARLKEFPEDMDLSNCTTIWYAFTNCHNVRKFPDILDLSSITSENNQAHAFDCVYGLLRFPTHITSKWSLMFGALTSNYTPPMVMEAFDYDSFAKFDENGEIVDGLVYHLNTCPNSGQTMTFTRNLYNHFTVSERTKIASMFNEKNWQLVW